MDEVVADAVLLLMLTRNTDTENSAGSSPRIGSDKMKFKHKDYCNFKSNLDLIHVTI